MNPLLSDLTGVTIGVTAVLVLLTLVIRYGWRRGKGVEEP